MIVIKKIFLDSRHLLFAICYLLFGLSTNAHAFVDKQTAVVRAMNKAAGTVQTVVMPVGGVTAFEKLTVTVRACKQTDVFETLDFWMFAEIEDDAGEKIFSGWMNKNDPGDNPLQDADFDLWLLRCE